jgi:hypothetical protein
MRDVYAAQCLSTTKDKSAATYCETRSDPDAVGVSVRGTILLAAYGLGGSGNTSGAPSSRPTKNGSHALTITATSGTLSHSSVVNITAD